MWDTSNFPLNLVRSLPTDDEADSSSRGSTALLPPLLYRKDIAELSVLVGAVFGLHSSASDESAESAEGGGDHGGGSGGIGSSGGGGGGGGQEEAPVFHRSPSITGLATLDGLEPTAALVGTLKIELGGWHPRSELLPTNRMNRMCECTASEFRELALDCLMALVSAEAAASGGDLDSSGHIDGIEAMVGYYFFSFVGFAHDGVGYPPTNPMGPLSRRRSRGRRCWRTYPPCMRSSTRHPPFTLIRTRWR